MQFLTTLLRDLKVDFGQGQSLIEDGVTSEEQEWMLDDQVNQFLSAPGVLDHLAHHVLVSHLVLGKKDAILKPLIELVEEDVHQA